jgi:DnaJ-domain-containing protein 1
MHRGIAHIWSIPNLSRSDRRNLMKHFEVQMRHHNVAAMANPRMYAEHHAGKAAQEAEAAARQQGQARERARQRASAGGSGEAPPRRSRWAHREQPHEILGIGPNASPAEIKRAFRKLSLQHHPDQGGSAEMFKKINDAHAHMSGKLNEMVMMLAEWITKRYKK